MYHHDKIILAWRNIKKAKTIQEIRTALRSIPFQEEREEYGYIEKEYKGDRYLFNNIVYAIKQFFIHIAYVEKKEQELRKALASGESLDIAEQKAEILKEFKIILEDSRLVNKYFKRLIQLEKKMSEEIKL